MFTRPGSVWFILFHKIKSTLERRRFQTSSDIEQITKTGLNVIRLLGPLGPLSLPGMFSKL